MLAAPCKSVEMAFAKCKNGIFSEIKYDGERVQLHKQVGQANFSSLSCVDVHEVWGFEFGIQLGAVVCTKVDAKGGGVFFGFATICNEGGGGGLGLQRPLSFSMK